MTTCNCCNEPATINNKIRAYVSDDDLTTYYYLHESCAKNYRLLQLRDKGGLAKCSICGAEVIRYHDKPNNSCFSCKSTRRREANYRTGQGKLELRAEAATRYKKIIKEIESISEFALPPKKKDRLIALKKALHLKVNKHNKYPTADMEMSPQEWCDLHYHLIKNKLK